MTDVFKDRVCRDDAHFKEKKEVKPKVSLPFSDNDFIWIAEKIWEDPCRTVEDLVQLNYSKRNSMGAREWEKRVRECLY